MDSDSDLCQLTSYNWVDALRAVAGNKISSVDAGPLLKPYWREAKKNKLSPQEKFMYAVRNARRDAETLRQERTAFSNCQNQKKREATLKSNETASSAIKTTQKTSPTPFKLPTQNRTQTVTCKIPLPIRTTQLRPTQTWSSPVPTSSYSSLSPSYQNSRASRAYRLRQTLSPTPFTLPTVSRSLLPSSPPLSPRRNEYSTTGYRYRTGTSGLQSPHPTINRISKKFN